MSLIGRDIVCFSTHYWDERRFRKQEFMERFSRFNRVLFVEPSFSMARAPEPYLAEVATNRFLLSSCEPRGERLHLLKPPRGLPKWNSPRVGPVNYRWYGRIVRRAMRRLDYQDPILWLYRPSYVHALGDVPHRHLVLDLVDDLSAYGGGHWAHVEQEINTLVERSDLVVVTAKTLLERYEPFARCVKQVSNGFDDRLFSPERVAHRVPADLASLPRPIIGFVGTLFGFLDFRLMADVALQNPGMSLVLVGPVEKAVEQQVTDLLELPNVVHLGPRAQADIPNYVAGFDVCLNPFLRGRVADSVSPLKVFEYLAMGRPVVSTPMKALLMEDAAEAVRFAETADSFSEQIGDALRESASASEERRRIIAPYSWDALFARLDKICGEMLVL